MANPTAVNVDEMMAPAKLLAELAMSNLEKVVSLNAELYTKYTNMTLDTVRAAYTVTDADTAKAFIEKQNAAAKDVAEGLIADSKVYAELNQEYSTEVQKVVATEIEKVSKKAA